MPSLRKVYVPPSIAIRKHTYTYLGRNRPEREVNNSSQLISEVNNEQCIPQLPPPPHIISVICAQLSRGKSFLYFVRSALSNLHHGYRSLSKPFSELGYIGRNSLFTNYLHSGVETNEEKRA